MVAVVHNNSRNMAVLKCVYILFVGIKMALQDKDVYFVALIRIWSLYFLDIYPHLPEIAEVIGWRDMRDLAMRCSIANTQIESCQLNHPQDAQEQTLELLKIWVEREGPNAGKTLVERLREMKKNAKAGSVRDILNG